MWKSSINHHVYVCLCHMHQHGREYAYYMLLPSIDKLLPDIKQRDCVLDVYYMEHFKQLN